MAETEVSMMMMKWGTWEELLLGGAVLRHGTQAWDAVAAEIRSRSPYPFSFTAQVCKAKYEDLQERYCGCNAWFEELRKRRVAELKRELEKSNYSIGTLETKLESLKGEEKGGDENYIPKYDSNRTESPISNGSSARVGFSGKEVSNSKDGLSAGSFTEENRALWSPEAQIPANVSTQETEIKQEEDAEKATPTTTSVETVGGGRIGGSLTKRRGKRKRKDCSKEAIGAMAKEGSFGESDVLSCIDATRGGDNHQVLKSAVDGEDHRNDPTATVKKEESSDLMEILSSFMEKGNANASVFRNRLDSQKKARYKKTIRCHVDFSTIRSRVADSSITSDKELFRDLLLLATNALVFYPKTSPEYISAAALRELAIKTFRHDREIPIRDTSCSGAGDVGGSDVVVVMAVEAPVSNPRVKPRSIRPRNRKVSATAVTEEVPKGESKNPCDVEVPPGFAPVEGVKKRVVKLVRAAGRGNATKRRHETATIPIVVEETPKGESKKSSEVGRGNGTKRRHETATVLLPIVEQTPKEESKTLPSVDIELPLLDPSLPAVKEPVKKVRVRSGNAGRGSRVKRDQSETPVTEKKRAIRR